MSTREELKAWTGATPVDETRLADLWRLLRADATGFAARLAGLLRALPLAASVPEAPRPVELEAALDRWLGEATDGRQVEDWLERHRQLGRSWARLGLPVEALPALASALSEGLWAVAVAEARPPETIQSILRGVGMVLGALISGALEIGSPGPSVSCDDVLLEHLPARTLLIDDQGRVSAATRSVETMFGAGRPLGRRWSEALPAPLVEAARLGEQLERVLATGEERVLPRVNLALDGREHAFRVHVVPVDHVQARLLVQVEELTETICDEQRVARVLASAQLRALSSAVAHELRNPLLGVSGAIHAIARTIPDDDRRKPIMTQIEGEVLRLDDVVKDLLSFSEPAVPEAVPTRLGDVAARALARFRLEHAGVSFRLEGEGTALADPCLLRQMLDQLLQNAVQAIDGAGEVQVGVGPGQILVSDSGPGIPEEQRGQVFAPFYTTRMRGVGLGLAICQKAAEAMGGTIALVPGPLSGASLRITLPLIGA